MTPTLDSLNGNALYLNPANLVAPHTMAQWPQYFNTPGDDEIDHLHLDDTVNYTSGTMPTHTPPLTNNCFPWSASTANQMSYSSSYGSGSNSLSSASMQYSLSSSSSRSSQPYATQRAVEPDYSSPEAISQQFNTLLQRETPGTLEYHRVWTAYQDWYSEYKASQGSQSGDAKTENVQEEDEDDNEEDSDSTLKIETPVGTAVSRAYLVTDPKTGKLKRIFPCPFQPCNAQPTRKADLDRHINSLHAKDVTRLLDCPQPGCARTGHRGFTRSDHLTEHLRNYHHMDEQYPKKGRKGAVKGDGKRRHKCVGAG